MAYLILGLLIFLGVHSVRIVAEGWRTARIARSGENGLERHVLTRLGNWSGIDRLGLRPGPRGTGGLVVNAARGHGMLRLADPAGLHPAGGRLRSRAVRIKAAVGHPMVAGVKLWALAHLLANGSLADLLLFGAFLAWAVADFIAARRRDRAAGRTYPALGWPRDAAVPGIGIAAWAGFAFWGHAWLIGVGPFRANLERFAGGEKAAAGQVVDAAPLGIGKCQRPSENASGSAQAATTSPRNRS
jgi:uncharacterized membrane protein